MSLMRETLEKSVTKALTIQKKLDEKEQLTPEEVAYVRGALGDTIMRLDDSIRRRKYQ